MTPQVLPLNHPQLLFRAGPVFQANKESKAKIVVNQGGTDSSKTISIMQVLTEIACTTKAPTVDPIISIVNESVPNSKKGAYRAWEFIYGSSPRVQSHVVKWTKEDRVVHFDTGWVMEFSGVTDDQSAKQGKRQYLFVNEANGKGITWLVFWQLAKRTRVRVFIDYNPSAPFWAHEKLIGTAPETNDLSAPVQTIYSDHRHNPFLTPEQHAETEGIKDKELWRVYARGMTGNLQGLIYTNWRIIPDDQYPWNEDRRFGGLDFGYTNDPTAGVDMRRVGNSIFVHELCYTPDMTPTQIKTLYRSRGYDEERRIFCDHDPDMIKQLRLLEVMALAARKGPGSIKAGIQKVKEYDIFVTASSKNIEFERKRYMWVIDEDTGKPINEPVDVHNHLMDAIRMGVYSYFYHGEG